MLTPAPPFVSRVVPSRRLQRVVGLEFAVAPAAPVAPSSKAVDPGFQTRVHSGRRALHLHRPPELNQYPVPTPSAASPWPSYAAPATNVVSFRRALQRLPTLDEHPPSPPAESPPGVLEPPRQHRRRAARGLFLAADAVVEAATVQPMPATLFARPLPANGRRRRTRFRALESEPINFVDKVPPAGEEYVTAWAMPPTLFRRSSNRRLPLALTMPFDVGQWPANYFVETLRRRETHRALLRLPLLSFYQPRPFVLPAFQLWPTFFRRATKFHTWLPLVPEHITLRVPPDSQSFPAFMAPQTAYRTSFAFRRLSVEAHIFGQAALALRLGVQPPHYVVGRMTVHGSGLEAPFGVTTTGVDGTITAVHVVDGSFDETDGHGGSVL